MHELGGAPVLVLYYKSGLTDDSCAIPTHAWASQGGSPQFPGFLRAGGSAAGLCSPDRSPSDDALT